MENINYNGTDGFFIPNNEFNYIKETINNNTLLLKSFKKELSKNNVNSFDYLLNNLWNFVSEKISDFK